MASDLANNLGAMIGAIGGLGTAAFGLLEALKPAVKAINRIGLSGIQRTVAALTPPEPAQGGAAAKPPINTLPHVRILQTLESNWINGQDLDSQKAIAKSLIKLHLSPGNAEKVADATNVDPASLTEVATAIVSGTPLVQAQSDAWSRFDLIVTAMLDECYQRADQIYRNRTRGYAALIAVILALAGWLVVGPVDGKHFGAALLIGIIATPLAPIAKDLSTALATAVNTMQLVKKA